MDPRCPRKLKSFPKTWCKLAVLKLKQLRTSNQNSEEDLDSISGCPWYINHQSSNYCFWTYIKNYGQYLTQTTEVELAHLLCSSVDSIKKIEKTALRKVKSSDFLKEVKRF